jgi:organic hydroperoxide reductase OsmC/OhrA
MGTYGGALEARQVKASEGALVADVTGEVEKADDGVIVLKRIHVVLRLKAPEEARATAERVHGFYAEKCPVYRSVKEAIDVTSELAFEAVG